MTHAPTLATLKPDANSIDFRFPVRPVNTRPETYTPPYPAAVTARTPDRAPQMSPYSNRQLEILKLLSKGLNSGEVAEELGISRETVRTHRQHILRRAGAPNMLAIVTEAVRANWI